MYTVSYKSFKMDLLDEKHDIILDKVGGPEYLCCVLGYIHLQGWHSLL